MKHQTSLVLFCLFTLITAAVPEKSFRVSNKRRQRHNLKLFVFGDSYVDTGNWPKSYRGSWHEPYGITFPGSPTGRFSDGRLFTDYIAGILGTKSPITYEGWKSGENKSIKYGMNFAYGGTGVFNTSENLPNMSTQIDYFQEFVQQKQHHLLNSSSIAIISLAGNDYVTYLASNHTLQEYQGLTNSVINQLISNIKRIHELGVRKIGVTTTVPFGCLPQFTASTSYHNCSTTENSIAEFHNQVLMESVGKLNTKSDDKAFVQILDIYKAFSSCLNLQQNHYAGNLNLLKPCCEGVTEGYFCGNIEKGTNIKKYKICGNTSDSFFWDISHPSQHGWSEVSSYLRSSILQLLL